MPKESFVPFEERKEELEKKALALTEKEIEELKKCADGKKESASREEIEEARYLLYLKGIAWETEELIKKEIEEIEKIKNEIENEKKQSKSEGRPVNLEEAKKSLSDKKETEEALAEIEKLKEFKEKLSKRDYEKLEEKLTLKILKTENPKLAKLMERKREHKENKEKLENIKKQADEEFAESLSPKIKERLRFEKAKKSWAEFSLPSLFWKKIRPFVPIISRKTSIELSHMRTKEIFFGRLYFGLRSNILIDKTLKYLYLEAGRPDIAFGNNLPGFMNFIRYMGERGEDITKLKPDVWNNPSAVIALDIPQVLALTGKGGSMEATWNLNQTLALHPWIVYEGIPKEVWLKMGLPEFLQKGERIDKYPGWAGIAGIIRFFVEKGLSVDPNRTVERMWRNTPLEDKNKLEKIFKALLTKITPDRVAGFDVSVFELNIKENLKQKGWKILDDGKIKDPQDHIWLYNPEKEIFSRQDNPLIIKKAEEIINIGSAFWLIGRFISAHQLGSDWTENSIYAAGKPEIQNTIRKYKNYFVHSETRERALTLEQKLKGLSKEEAEFIDLVLKTPHYQSHFQIKKPGEKEEVERFVNRKLEKIEDVSFLSFEKKVIKYIIYYERDHREEFKNLSDEEIFKKLLKEMQEEIKK